MDSLNSLSYANDKEEVKQSDQDENSGTVSEEAEEQDGDKMNNSSGQKSNMGSGRQDE